MYHDRVSLPYGFTLFSNYRTLFCCSFCVLLPYGFTLFSNKSDNLIVLDPVLLPYGFTLFSNQALPELVPTIVLLPYGFTLFSNQSAIGAQRWLVLLPYGFTLFSNITFKQLTAILFYYLMDLHYSQTGLPFVPSGDRFYYLMDLHYSQTVGHSVYPFSCFTTLWIYTILKLYYFHSIYSSVSLPYGFTLFSNSGSARWKLPSVSLPYGFTLFSNPATAFIRLSDVSLPYGFTLFSNHYGTPWNGIVFHYLMDLHYSQTRTFRGIVDIGFHYLMDLHYSQTVPSMESQTLCFTTLWIYTILKPDAAGC